MIAEPALADAVLRTAPDAALRADARRCVDLAFAREASGRGYLARQFVAYPVHVGRALHVDAAARDLCVVYLQSVSGGLFEHERLAGSIELAAGARAHVATPASTIVHAMQGGCALQSMRLQVAPDALLEYMPAPLILFPGSHMVSDIEVELADDARVIVADSFLAHDHEGGDGSFRRIESAMTVRATDGRLLARERMCLDGALWRTNSAGGHGGLRMHGTLWMLGRGADAGLLAELRALPQGAGCLAGASLLPHSAGIVFRVLASDAVGLEHLLHAAWRAARIHFTGAAPGLRRR
ncbi:urease accessory protein UreD [Methyloversatilis thermotolerans]|uniref:urease accessory protein UreD n=1 Tax=Methyloversatilis thermotolerans TaxID=1346290 RepID=UPI00036C51DB|nr:urease accessory protein UreD [Methyloversatilis thermotolerans]